MIISIHALLAESDKCCKGSDDSRNRFLSTLSLRRATISQLQCRLGGKYFYPRSPCGERLHVPSHNHGQNNISIHALLAESDVMHALKLANFMLFLSTLSLRRATRICQIITIIQDFYPRSPCGERPWAVFFCYHYSFISIHALLAESDSKSAQNSGALLRI